MGLGIARVAELILGAVLELCGELRLCAVLELCGELRLRGDFELCGLCGVLRARR